MVVARIGLGTPGGAAGVHAGSTFLVYPFWPPSSLRVSLPSHPPTSTKPAITGYPRPGPHPQARRPSLGGPFGRHWGCECACGPPSLSPRIARPTHRDVPRQRPSLPWWRCRRGSSPPVPCHHTAARVQASYHVMRWKGGSSGASVRGGSTPACWCGSSRCESH